MTKSILLIVGLVFVSSSSVYFEHEKYTPNQFKFTRITLIIAKDSLIGNFSATIADYFQTKLNKCGIETRVFTKDLRAKNYDTTALNNVLKEFNPNGVFFIAPKGTGTHYSFGGTNPTPVIYFPCHLHYRDDSGHYTLIYSVDMFVDPQKIDNAGKVAGEKLFNSLGKHNKQINCP